ncbi:hypothetical protein COEREDRAFT_79126 [Coemansia reversa NRRL 1564]|uniref:Ubinuclein middle domain-containing protein n=1 Tax=Coemansia reversa (strain ATCC 12441 / NRRL 1564) TaxID=763665 RepID=A0A2G5BJD8_COERN|nr:hypothetical protein COEREDRAFT_79126 [Coemansia reversa NRRL 1564]|eukprot:PIA19154.1 hypothetical protein COEREDRAFT_79126 [Coemansia reversa NRRL 1564]
MDLPGPRRTAKGDRSRQVSVPLRPGACTIVDWAQGTLAEGDSEDEDKGKELEHGSEAASDGEGTDSSEEGYTSNAAPSVPAAIANDPFFARLLRNAELHEESEREKGASKRAAKRRAKEVADDMYDLEDPFIDDSELTLMNGHNYTGAHQRKRRRKRDDGNNSESEGRVVGTVVAAADGDGEDGHAPNDNASTESLDDPDRYEEDDFFVYYGPLNESEEEEAASEKGLSEAPAKGARSRNRQTKKQPAKETEKGRKKGSGALNTKSDGGDTAGKKKTQHRLTGSDSAQIPSNGRKSGARSSRKLDQAKSTSTSGIASTSAADDRQHYPPIPDRDRTGVAGNGKSDKAGLSQALETATAEAENKEEGGGSKTQQPRRAGTPAASAAVSSTATALDDSKAVAQARMPTAEIEAALAELKQATQNEAFTNRQRFPSSLKPSLRQVCELSMARALEYDREMLALDVPEHRVFAWSTPTDIVGFTTNIYHRMSAILPYNRATVRKIVSKLLGQDLLTWKEQQLKQIEEGLKARVDEQIEKNMGWIPVAVRAGAKDGEELGSGGGSQVRWHWTTLSKHVLFQYMVLTLNINELRNSLGQNTGKDGAYREQQARKDAYARLVKLWPGSSMSTYEISRAYSSRKSLIEKQIKKTDSTPVTTTARAGGEAQVPVSNAGAIATASSDNTQRRTPEHLSPNDTHSLHGTSTESPADPATASLPTRYDSSAPLQTTLPLSPYMQSSSPQADCSHRLTHFDTYRQSPSQRFDGPANQPSPLQKTLYDSVTAAGFPAQSSSSHRSLDFAGGRTDVCYEKQHTPQASLEDKQQQHNQQQDNDDDHNTPRSSRYSMSVHNLTTP